MVSSLFISYCRREAPFVDSLLEKLENQGFKVWLDYHTLIPGKLWKEQIYTAIVEAEVFLLVVSKESIASENVEWEWRQAIDLKKRVILVIFEAVELPPELKAYEWVDLRGSFRKGVKKLVGQIEFPTPQEHAPPERGFKAPATVWIAFCISLIVGFLSLLSFWSLYIPYYLLPLPYRILKRNFNFFQIQMALIMLPIVASLSCMVLSPDGADYSENFFLNYLMWGFLLSPIFSFVLILLLRSSGMQRWGKPIASRPKFANPYTPKKIVPKPIRFFVDSAPEDKKYTNAVIKKLKKYQHFYVADAQSAEVVILLLSVFKNKTDLNIGEKVIYPVILQSVKDIDPEIQRFQWIDFRRGLKNLDRLAQLLPEPTKLLKALGIVPSGYQTVLPSIVAIFVYYLTLLAIFTVAGWGIFFYYMRSAFSFWEVSAILLLLGVFWGAIFLTIRSLINRQGRMASLRSFNVCFRTRRNDNCSTYRWRNTLLISGDGVFRCSSNRIIFCTIFYVFGLIIVGLLSVWYWRDLWRWFPIKNRTKKRD